MSAPLGAGASVAASAAGAGLVPSKTNRHLFVNLAPSASAERRVNRLKRSVWASGHLHGLGDKGFRALKAWFVTLTYRGVDDWRSNHVSKALQGYRNWCKSVGVQCRYTWVGELQKRGAVHYHLLAWLPVGFRMPQWDRPYRLASGKEKSCLWPHGMTNTELAKSGVGYLMKYLSKLGELTRFPKGLRLYGIGGLNDTGRAVRSWYNLPEWAKCEYGVGDLVRKSCGLLVRATGEVLEPVYRVILRPAGFELIKLRDTAERFHAGAYSSVNFGGVHG